MTPLWVLLAVTHAYGFVLIGGAALARTDLLAGERFTRAKFYALTGWVPLTFALLALLVSPRYVAFFAVAGVLGVVAEVIVSLVWRAFFHTPIWSYSYGAQVRGYTSTLNLLPWATGGLLFHVTGRAVGGALAHGEVLRPAIVAASAASVGLVVAWIASRVTSARRGVLSGPAFAVFCLPIVATALALGLLSDWRYPVAMACFAVVGFATEYGYGRGMRLFFDRGLWTYNHWRIDGGHTSYVTFPLWAIGGLFFHFLARAVGL